ncbi:MAG: ferric reductase-like transmembrane domain-containing protein [Mesorhizobium sp.]|nr:ferric reductase-like transmembrane domain-containing protein [Mesorhizobium sp.]
MSSTIVFWIAAAFAALALPFVVLLSGERVEGNELLFDFSMGLGFGALALAGLQFALTARFRRMTLPFGVDIIYLFHRYLALGAVAIMLAHFAILYFWYEDILGVLNPLEARWELTAGRVALGCFVVLVISSEFRKVLKLEYELWRYLHVALALIGFGAAVAHVLGVGRFTAAADQRALWLGVTLGWLLLLLWVRLGKPWMQKRNPWKLVENIERRGGVHSLVLEPQGKPLSGWKPGQFVWLTLENSPFGLREHPYTVSNAPEEGPNIMLSIKPLGDFSERAIRTEPGATAYIDGPYGVFSIDSHPEATGFVMIAGGIGITPMMSSLLAMRARGDRRPVMLFYANPNWDDVTFRDELETLSKQIDLKVVHVLEEPPEDWAGEEGFLTEEILEKHLPGERDGFRYFLCGPTPMTDAARQALLKLGAPLAHIDAEIFDMV